MNASGHRFSLRFMRRFYVTATVAQAVLATHVADGASGDMLRMPFAFSVYIVPYCFSNCKGFCAFFQKIFEGCTCGEKAGMCILGKSSTDPPKIRHRERATASGKQGPRSVATKRKRKKGVSPQPLATTLLWGTAYSVTSGPGSGTVACARNPEGRRIRRSMALFMRLPLRYPAA